jgi:hypothetical protein
MQNTCRDAWETTARSFLFADPLNVFAQSLVREQGFFGVIVLGQLLLVRKKIVNAVVTEATDHDPAPLHFALFVAALKAAAAMHGPRDQMMPREPLKSSAQVADADRPLGAWHAWRWRLALLGHDSDFAAVGATQAARLNRLPWQEL